MLLADIGVAIVTTCRELSRAELVVGTAGNASVRDARPRWRGHPERRALGHADTGPGEGAPA